MHSIFAHKYHVSPLYFGMKYHVEKRKFIPVKKVTLHEDYFLNESEKRGQVTCFDDCEVRTMAEERLSVRRAVKCSYKLWYADRDRMIKAN